MRSGVEQNKALKHVQVREHVRMLVGSAHPGTPAPSERELVQHFGVARMTVRQAMDSLVSEGLLERIPGRGTFVAKPPRMATSVTGFSFEAARRGQAPASETLLIRSEHAGPNVARTLGVDQGSGVIHWRRLRQTDGVPIAIQDIYLNSSMLPDFLDEPLPPSLYEYLDDRGLQPTWAEDMISAERASAQEAELLQIPEDDPVLVLRRRSLVEDVVIEACRCVFRGDAYAMRIALS
jgi:GntR family transcriptional regulator